MKRDFVGSPGRNRVLEKKEIMDAADFLGDVSIFSHLKGRDLKRIVKLARMESFEAGDVIVGEGDRDGRLFVILEGEAEVIKGLGGHAEWRLQTLSPRSYFGEMAMIGDWVRTASVVARTYVEVLTLDQLNLRQEIEKYPIIAIELLQMLTRRIQALEKNLVGTLAAFLPLCEKRRPKSEEGGTTLLPRPPAGDYPFLDHILCEECARILQDRIYRKD
jgi:CRP-like cAMP-binding protein